MSSERGTLARWWDGKADARAKFHAWWEGYEFQARGRPAAAPEAAAPPPVLAEPRPRAKPTGRVLVREAWPPERVKVAQMVWGDGFSFPGGIDYTVALTQTLSLARDGHGLDIGCGLGGGTRAVACAYGAIVDGYDLTPELAHEGHGLSIAASLGDRAPIDFLDIDRDIFKQKHYDAALIRNTLSLMSEKALLLKRVAASLKPGGRMLVVEFCLAREDAHGAALDAYRAGEATAPRLATLPVLASRIKEAGLAVLGVEDHTETFMRAVLTGWAKIDALVKRGELNADEGRALIGEAELWQRRVSALQSGDLRVARILATAAQ
jgi:SAM-dependent methyltransferase